MCDIELLISLVKQHQCIWNVDHEDYHNPYNKEQAWKEICKEMCENWDKASPMERKRACALLRKKWKNLRLYYRDVVLKRYSPNLGGKQDRKYVYAEHLSFLLPIIMKCKTKFETVSCNGSTEPNPEPTEFETAYIQVKIEGEDDDTEELPLAERSAQSTGHSKQENTVDLNDDDTLFLLSLQSHMRDMDMTKKLDFKISVMDVVKECIPFA
ncbi:uncharacterized protein LOC114248742 [Bombyx mandarina]|uniref:MADF domain-containing protein n=3 Tax=Bombyx TaxID=7090 RepID=A0A8R2G7E2_BOMMO|nr:uncharacterized protein LOC101741620 isoform X1 [Bombyx mori]XP_028037953.1 uncharacterized protein LOC114248742 [Bombyx mandarina]